MRLGLQKQVLQILRDTLRRLAENSLLQDLDVFVQSLILVLLIIV